MDSRLGNMKRRTALKGTAAGAAVVGGYATFRLVDASSQPGPVTGIEFTSSVQVDMDIGPEDPPVMEARAETTVHITGRQLVGNPNNEIDIETVEYDEETDELQFVVAPHRPLRTYVPPFISFADILEIDTYEALISFEQFPQLITATEINHKGEEFTSTLEPGNEQD